jgi:tRNA A37 threonylcarbamoyladenosine dehydratase
MTNDRFSRQSFLGQNSQSAIQTATIGLVGLGGGGSHVVQQLAHVGFLDYIVYDGDAADESNLNRLVTATEVDAEKAVPKIDLVRRKILSIRSDAKSRHFRAAGKSVLKRFGSATSCSAALMDSMNVANSRLPADVT